MGNFVELSKVGDLEEGTMKEVAVKGREILLARVGENYYATDSLCPHLGGRLVRGTLEGAIVTCPLHRSQFDLSDGHVVRWTNLTGWVSKVSNAIRSERPLATYPVKVEEDTIFVEI